MRDRLYRVAKHDALPGRLRALATISLGLLGDQPTASRALAKATLARLFKLLAIRHRYMDLTAALLHAASFQPEAAWTEEQRALLTTVLRTGGLPGGGRTFALDAQAAIALGRIAGPGDLALFAEMIGPKHVRRRNVRRSTVIALGTLAERHDGATRTAVAALLSAALPLERDPTTRKLLTIALGRTAAAAIRATRTFDETAQGLAGLLHATLRPGDDAAAPLPRNASYAMLGLALIGRALADVSAPAGPAWRQTTGTVLRRAAEDAGQSERHRAGAAMALGLLGRSADRDVLLALLSDTERTPLLRGAAARALGLVGPADAATLSLLHALFEESPRWPVRVHAAGALAALGDHTATEFLVTQLQARHASDQGAAAQALGNLGSAALVERRLAILQDGNQPMRARMAACAALGCMGDPEPRPSLARVVNDMNWRAGGGLFHWLADLL
ncbi:MAG: HEAT repeat domain-containing protein [Planctomycetota bacterium]|nr:HEAT repeat domain-containing protein [Planctomycetota bacterium]